MGNSSSGCAAVPGCDATTVDQRLCGALAGGDAFCRLSGGCYALEVAADCNAGLPLAACVPGPGGGSCVQPSLTLTLDRDDTASPSPVVATLEVRDVMGAPWTGRNVTFSSPGLITGPVTELPTGLYRARLTPTQPSGEYVITGTLTVAGSTLSAQHTVLILPFVDAQWGQPEPVRGLVNTAAYEDGASISPDGQWLILTDYSPVNGFCCITGCGSQTPLDPNSPFCQTVVGPYGPPQRPDFPGAWRIQSPTRVLNLCPKACFTSDYTATGGEVPSIALPPLGSYMFHRQPDGSFAEPRFVGIDADGCVVPTGMSFTEATSGMMGELIYSFGAPFGAPTNLHVARVNLGSTNVLASFQCTGAGVSVPVGTPLHQEFSNFTLGLQASNAVLRAGYLGWDAEELSPKKQYFAAISGTLPNATFTPAQEIPVGTLTDDHSQPFFHLGTGRLYYTSNGAIVSSQVLGVDPANPASWGPETAVLTPEPSTARPGSIISIGQATVASPGTGNEIYFVYVVWDGSAINANIGMVRQR